MQSSRLSRFFSQSKFDTFLRAQGFDDFVGIGQTHPDKLASSFIVVYQQDRSYTPLPPPRLSALSSQLPPWHIATGGPKDKSLIERRLKRITAAIFGEFAIFGDSQRVPLGDLENLKRFLRRNSIPRSAALPVERLNYTLQPLPHRRPKTYAWAAFILG